MAQPMRRTVTILTVVGMSLVAVFGLVWTQQRALIYFPTQAVGDVSGVSSDSEEVTFTTGDGLTLSAWWVPASGVPTGSTVAVFPGNGGNRADRATLALALADRGYDVLLTDYRGYGGNPGRPTEKGLLLDATAAIDYLRSRSGVDPDRLVYFGESLGAAVAVAVSQALPPSALVLRSPFTSLPDVASAHYPFLPASLLMRDRYPSIEIIGTLDVPVLVVAGSADTIVPFSQSARLYEAAADPKRFVTIDGADHNDPELTHGTQLIEGITSFLDKFGGGQ